MNEHLRLLGQEGDKIRKRKQVELGREHGVTSQPRLARTNTHCDGGPVEPLKRLRCRSVRHNCHDSPPNTGFTGYQEKNESRTGARELAGCATL